MSEIPARQVVPGDIVQIEAGDVVPADMRLISTVDLGADESALTGESVPVSKTDEVVDISAPALGERLNMAYKGTLVTRGRASGVVIATGRATEIGRIADLLRGARNARTPLQLRLARFSRRIALVVLAICAIVFATGMLQGQPALLMFMTALSLAVAAVPEALPAVITLSLGIGARRLGENSALRGQDRNTHREPHGPVDPLRGRRGASRPVRTIARPTRSAYRRGTRVVQRCRCPRPAR
jgi:Ca2+-transporting ATPase